MSKSPFRFIGKHRRAVEHKRFVLGQGHFAADIQLQGMLHIAFVASLCQRQNQIHRCQPSFGYAGCACGLNR